MVYILNIKEIRNKTNLSQSQFCNYFKIPLSTLQKWERGVSRTPVYLLELLDYKIENELKNGGFKK